MLCRGLVSKIFKGYSDLRGNTGNPGCQRLHEEPGAGTTKQHQPMKTSNMATLALTVSIALAGSLSAAPRGKHVIEKYPHRHGAQGANKAPVEHTVLKRIGPPGKGFRNPFYKRR